MLIEEETRSPLQKEEPNDEHHCTDFTNTQTKPISSSITRANLLLSKGGKGTIDVMSNSSIVFATSLHGYVNKETEKGSGVNVRNRRSFQVP